MAEVPFYEAAIIGAVGTLVLLFLWNLACAPYRLERDKKVQAERQISDLAAKIVNLEKMSLPRSSTPLSLNLKEYDSETRTSLIRSVIDIGQSIREKGADADDLKARVNALTKQWDHLPNDYRTSALTRLYAEVCFHAIDAREHLLGRGMLGLYFCDPVTSDVFGMLHEVTNQVVNALHGLDYDLSVIHRMNQNSDFELGMLDKIDFAKRERRFLDESSASIGEDLKPQSPPKTES